MIGLFLIVALLGAVVVAQLGCLIARLATLIEEVRDMGLDVGKLAFDDQIRTKLVVSGSLDRAAAIVEEGWS